MRKSLCIGSKIFKRFGVHPDTKLTRISLLLQKYVGIEN